MDQPARDQSKLGRGDLTQQQVSEAENILGLDKVVQRLEASKTRPRLADGGSKLRDNYIIYLFSFVPESTFPNFTHRKHTRKLNKYGFRS